MYSHGAGNPINGMSSLNTFQPMGLKDWDSMSPVRGHNTEMNGKLRCKAAVLNEGHEY